MIPTFFNNFEHLESRIFKGPLCVCARIPPSNDNAERKVDTRIQMEGFEMYRTKQIVCFYVCFSMYVVLSLFRLHQPLGVSKHAPTDTTPSPPRLTRFGSPCGFRKTRRSPTPCGASLGIIHPPKRSWAACRAAMGRVWEALAAVPCGAMRCHVQELKGPCEPFFV